MFLYDEEIPKNLGRKKLLDFRKNIQMIPSVPFLISTRRERDKAIYIIPAICFVIFSVVRASDLNRTRVTRAEKMKFIERRIKIDLKEFRYAERMMRGPVMYAES